MRFGWMILMVGCGRWEGNWEGSCDNPATGETRVFNIDIDEDKGGSITGTAFMTIKDNRGDTTIINCEVSGDSSRSGVKFDFVCDNDETFEVDAEETNGDLLAYCDDARESELLLVLD